MIHDHFYIKAINPAPELDANAQTFITNSGITNEVIIDAINKLVIDTKEAGIWDKMHTMYPFAGGTAATHKLNLKNSLDTNAAFRLTFSGGWVHSATGAKPNGVNAYANTYYTPSLHATSIDDFSFGVYIRENIDEGKVDIGSAADFHNAMYVRWGGLTYYSFGPSAYSSWGTSDSRGFFIVNRKSSTNSQGFQDTLKKRETTDYNSIRGLSTGAMYLGARGPGAGAIFSSKEQAFAFTGQGLTEVEVKKFYAAVQLFQNRLSRAV